MSYVDRLFIPPSDNSSEIESSRNDAIAMSELPWAKFFGEIGADLARANKAQSPVVLALSVPSREFCSALIATGIITELASAFRPVKGSKAAYFKYLRSLPVDTVFDVIKPGTTEAWWGIKTGECDLDGKMRIVFRALLKKRPRGRKDEQPQTWMWHEGLCYNHLLVAPDQGAELPDVLGRPVKIGDHALATALLAGSNNIDQFYTTAQMECLIIGNTGPLKDEICETPFCVPMSNPSSGSRRSHRINSSPVSFQIGTLQELLQIKRFGSAGIVHKADVTGALSPTGDFYSNQSIGTIIFDGSLAFSRWNAYYRGSNWVVILDRTDSSGERYDLAVLGLINDWLQHRVTDPDISLGSETPPGIDVLYYGRR